MTLLKFSYGQFIIAKLKFKKYNYGTIFRKKLVDDFRRISQIISRLGKKKLNSKLSRVD